MARFYTGTGDSGSSRVMGRALRKSDVLFNAIGDIDELNSTIGVAVADLTDDNVSDILRGVQNCLFIIGAELSGYKAGSGRMITENDVKVLESAIKEYGIRVGTVERFVLPGGSVGGASLQHARSVARRAERSIVSLEDKKVGASTLRYMNRLSSMLFVMALYINKKEGCEELNPDY